MARLLARLRTLRHDQRGATAVEYGALVALAVGVVVSAVVTLGAEIRDAADTVVGML